MKKFLCRFGWHQWGMWATFYASPSLVVFKSTRVCSSCGLRKYKETYI